jgi:subtilase family protein
MAVQRILVKARGGVPDVALAFGGSAVPLASTPLFESIGDSAELGAAAADRWFVLTSPLALDEANPWDTCHALMQQGFGMAGVAAPEFAEPDLPQQWPSIGGGEEALMLGSSCEQAEPQDVRFPTNPDPFWFRDAQHSEFDAALQKVGGPGIAAKVRIAHFDTGYDPDHKSVPTRLRRNLARNFVDDGSPKDATDVSEGLLNNFGHGTGTLGILAGAAVDGGAPLGGAPFAEVVPVRVANRVVLFFTSAIAKAFDYVHRLNRAPQTRVDIITMSMGGLASQAWAEAVNALYDQGVFIVTAAGNNFGNLPTRHIVYPARFNRVVAACGVMADGTPYADLGLTRMAGNYGPSQKMTTAMSAYTPNTPWAKIGCPDIVDRDGAGTSSATPQVAAAAAIWAQHNRAQLDQYPQAWMRVEAIRKALFDSAKSAQTERLGRGLLRARAALDQAPAAAANLKRQDQDSASFPLLRTVTGLGVDAAEDPRQRMIELEALQLSQGYDFERLLPTPEELAAGQQINTRQVAEALASHPRASQALKNALRDAERERVPEKKFLHASLNAVEKLHIDHAINPGTPKPPQRPLRVYAYDPSLGADLATIDINEAILNVRWEDDLEPGPIGEYVEVIDVDPASRRCYAPVDLNDPYLLTQSGLPPSEANPQFHQQMVYAVAMKTIEHFENALGRQALWAPRRIDRADGSVDEQYVQRLRIYPHALRARNAFYSPDRKALLLGYFRAHATDSGKVLPGGMVFTAVSHDIIAHETTHALLDGLHRRFREPTNKDVLGFHEAFADIVALFQHFTLPAALREQIRQTRGRLEEQNLLAKLAVQFGEASGRYGALRDAIGKVENGRWMPAEPQRNAYSDATEAHDLGAVLVAAVFDAFLQIYKRRTADLIRLATSGTGVLREGEIPADLVDRLAQEASKIAGHVLAMCIRALDYCPPVDITFGEYLRAIVTADADLVPNDVRGYRTAFIAAFRDRGIYPSDVKHLASSSLLWEPPPLPLDPTKLRKVLEAMSLIWSKVVSRKDAYEASERNAYLFWEWLMDPANVKDEELDALGLRRIPEPMKIKIGNVEGELRKIEVHSVRFARRVGPDDNLRSDVVVEITQSFRPDGLPGARYRGGCTMLIELQKANVRYLVRKKVENVWRLDQQLAFAAAQNDSLRANYFSGPSGHDEPFALLHTSHQLEQDDGKEATAPTC